MTRYRPLTSYLQTPPADVTQEPNKRYWWEHRQAQELAERLRAAETRLQQVERALAGVTHLIGQIGVKGLCGCEVFWRPEINRWEHSPDCWVSHARRLLGWL